MVDLGNARTAAALRHDRVCTALAHTDGRGTASDWRTVRVHLGLRMRRLDRNVPDCQRRRFAISRSSVRVRPSAPAQRHDSEQVPPISGASARSYYDARFARSLPSRGSRVRAPFPALRSSFSKPGTVSIFATPHPGAASGDGDQRHAVRATPAPAVAALPNIEPPAPRAQPTRSIRPMWGSDAWPDSLARFLVDRMPILGPVRNPASISYAPFARCSGCVTSSMIGVKAPLGAAATRDWPSSDCLTPTNTRQPRCAMWRAQALPNPDEEPVIIIDLEGMVRVLPLLSRYP